MTQKQTIGGLKYIADSPAKEHGGFHAMTVEIAKSALRIIRRKAKKKCHTK